MGLFRKDSVPKTAEEHRKCAEEHRAAAKAMLSTYKMSRPNVQKILYKNVQLVCLL